MRAQRADVDPMELVRGQPVIDVLKHVSVRVHHPDKGFDARAWIKLFGYSGEQLRRLLG